MMITGAATGIGAGIAAAASAAGYQTLLIDIDAARVEAVARGLNHARGFKADVTNAADIERVLDEAGVVPDALVNNAGIVRFGPLIDLSPESFRAVLDVNVTGVFVTAQAVARRMMVRGTGAIVNMSSINATHAAPSAGAYPATKAAVVRLTEQMALEWSGTGLRVNSIAPGFIDAGMSTPIYANARVRELRSGAVPLQRLGTAEDVANAVLFLVSDQAAYINGHELTVDGGVIHSVLAHLPRD